MMTQTQTREIYEAHVMESEPETHALELVSGSAEMTPAAGGMFTLAAVEAAEQRLALRERLMAAVLQTIPAHNWVDFGGRPYLEGWGASKLLTSFGLAVRNKRFKWEKDLKGRDYCRATADVTDAGGRVVCEAIGTRYPEGFVGDANDCESGALQNAMSRAARELFGIGGMTWDELAHYGVKNHGKAGATFNAGSKGGKAPARNDQGVACVPFGKKQGTPVTELTTPDLEWYANAALQSVNDPTKATYKAKNQAWLDACTAEFDRRAAEQSGPPEGGA